MKSDDRESILIYGAGHTGYQIASSLMQARKYEVIAFIDDDKKLTNTTVRGVAVHSSDSVANLIKLYNVKTILLALGQTTKSNRSSIVEKLEKFEVKIQTVPTLEDLLYGQAHGQEIRDIEIEDLLGRDPIPPRKDLLDQCVRDKVVMVTGAGGSIGSELCRQILSESPSKLILFEQNEFNLYRVESELKQHFPNENLFSVLGTTLDRTLVSSVICNFNIQTIYHAAAYKHVPMVEKNIVEGVKNNALGTWECAKAAIEHSVENFVLISTDKAVRPTNIMGASKRLAELILQGLSKKESKTKLSMVRFGNVLGSSGSVVPLFKQQIAGGGPITVTHKNITRYFMTIPEAAQLVIQASAMSMGGDVFVLDMGEPIRIWDLAERMVRMSGLSVKSNTNPDGDIEIRQIGLRPGEKLYEELLVSNDVRGTEHPLIMRATEASLSWLETQKLIEELIQHCKDFNAVKLRELIANAPTHYSYDGINYDLLENQKEKIVSIDSAKLTRLRPGKQNTD
ncbi:polysaccharide biosynthesis protein [Sessilibacter corallicola]|uniref:polysaccharide biosynthesis protein n=1 Tax=Sessilibacter corallicola TaxID=2904075 RepID=UPI001E354F03|nr:nucleoside-diphosphate sugar epimerase/dehydratase [Sessilibacter corallicola]MCE2028969.1 polysaccharide biosynthesis protein [Sessilibacter corallicola]